jgi:hypothetical protein
MTACRCPACCPSDPGKTFTPEYRLFCEARAVCRMQPKAARQSYLKLVREKRGIVEAERLRLKILELWEES